MKNSKVEQAFPLQGQVDIINDSQVNNASR
jgi:hypothetical protein